MKATFCISTSQLTQQLLHIGGLQNLPHGDNLLIDHDGGHGHDAVFHNLFHIGNIFHLNGQPQCFDSSLCVLVLLMAGLAACAQNLDAADALCRSTTAAGTGFLRLGSGATAAAGGVLGLWFGPAAAGRNLLFLFFLAKIEQCHSNTSIK